MDDLMRLQGLEFEAMAELARQWKRLSMTAVVDDDYPHVRQDWEHALDKFVKAYEKNRHETFGGPVQISIARLQEQAKARSELWHGIQSWSSLEWAGAMCGEAGEAANYAKKLLRIDQGIAKRKEELEKTSRETIVNKLGEECADVLIYLVCLCARENINLQTWVQWKFNAISVEFGFPQKL